MTSRNLCYILLVLSIGCTPSVEEKETKEKELISEPVQGNTKKFKIGFPSPPKVFTTNIPIKNESLKMTSSSLETENGVYLLFEFELNGLRKEVENNPNDFFKGIVFYLMNDMGVQVGAFQEYTYQEYKGNNFDLISPVKGENRTAKGKTLLVDDKAYIWISVFDSKDSQTKVNTFMNSFTVEE